MKKLALLALLGLMGSVPAMAQNYENDRRYCASGRSGLDFNACMWRLQNDRERPDRRDYERRDYERREYERRQRWQEPEPVYVPQYRQQPQYQQQEQPRLSDMQQRALDNCNFLQPRDQPRCRATVMSTVR